MQIFKNRPVFSACILFMTFSVICFLSALPLKIIFAAVAILVTIGFTVLLALKKISANTAVTAILCGIFVFMSATVSIIYFDVIYKSNYELETGSEHEMVAIVLSESYSAGASSEYTVLVTRLDGKSTSIKANLECEYLGNLQIGNQIQGKFCITEFDEDLGAYKEKDMMLSDGIVLALISSAIDDFRVVKQDAGHILSTLAKWNVYLSNKIIYHLGEDNGSVAASLLLGNPDIVPKDISRDFRRVGASHILAISGTHMTILFGFLALVLKFLYVPYKTRAIILSFLSVFYLALTGFSMSATRSVIMLLLVYFSMISSHMSDSLTSLSIAGTIILGITPFAVVDAGFWMSFAATFGILVYIPHFQNYTFERLQPYYSKWKWIISPCVSLVTLILTSLCAIAPLIIVLCIFTREVSVYAILSSLILGLPTEIMLILTPFYLIFANVPIIGHLLHWALEFCCNITIGFCREFSLEENALVSFNYEFVTLAAVLLGIVLLVCMAVKFKRVWLSPIPFVSALAVFFIIVGISGSKSTENIRISYVNVPDNRNMIIATSGDNTFLFDMTPGYYSSLNAAFDECASMNITEIDAIVLTSYTTAHISALSKSFQAQMIRKLYIPYPRNNDDYFRMISTIECAQDNGVDVEFYEPCGELELIENLKITIKREFVERSTAPIVMLTFEANNEKLTYISPSYEESDISHDAFEQISSTNYLIFGSRGPTPTLEYKIRNGAQIKEIVFSSNRVASYYDTSSFVSPDTKLVLCPQIRRYEFFVD